MLFIFFKVILMFSITFAQNTGSNNRPLSNKNIKDGGLTSNSAAFNSALEAPSFKSSDNQTFMKLFEDVFKTQNDLKDHFSGLPVQFPTEVDFIVVGGGSAGSAVASRLSEVSKDQSRNWTVLLIESGGPAPTTSSIPGFYFNYQKSPIDWNYVLEPQKRACLAAPEGRCRWPRGKVLGGTSVLNGMMYMRGHPKDYNEWLLPGWSWEEVQPFFLRSEDNRDIGTQAAMPEYHTTGGLYTIQRFPDQPQLAWNILEAAQELGFSVGGDLNANRHLGFTVAQAMQRGGVRLNSAKAFLEPAIDRPNLIVLLESTVHRVIIDPMTKHAQGVEYSHNGVIRTVRARKEIILSAGAVASPQLLMLSGVGPKGHLRSLGIPVIKNLPGVGNNLLNHVSVSIPFKIRGKKPKNLMNVDTIKRYLIARKGPLSSTGLSQITGFVKVNKTENDDRPDIQIFFEGFNANYSRTGSSQEDMYAGDQFFKIVPTLLRQSPLGSIKLRSNNPFDPPVIQANYLQTDEEVQRLRQGVRLAVALSRSPALKRINVELDPEPDELCSFYVFESDQYWDCVIAHRTNPENHQCGTCAMGNSDNVNAVLDPKLRVRGIKGLRVIDASSIPRVPSCNLAAPVTMVAEKGADLIRRLWLR
ncbi:glucose dehydrogenase [FAD, quinone] [Cephus cinctus]|uniref:Glucose dehydrogenase [FAD, quinone] n=1 Tax=Cephus cinctus TaxID=211228 RepID=A0AAJ7C2Y8_CEPCN|nr:glucose dehydrogenase [FAD, quinone] [Cephus cinctus]